MLISNHDTSSTRALYAGWDIHEAVFAEPCQRMVVRVGLRARLLLFSTLKAGKTELAPAGGAQKRYFSPFVLDPSC